MVCDVLWSLLGYYPSGDAGGNCSGRPWFDGVEHSARSGIIQLPEFRCRLTFILGPEAEQNACADAIYFRTKFLRHDGKKTGGDTARVVVRKDTQNKHTAATMATKLTQCIVPPNRLASIISWGPSAR